MSLSGWGNYPTIQSQRFDFRQHDDLRTIISEHHDLIPRGNGRSYGDSSLSQNVIDVKPHDLFLDFDEDNGSLHVQAGVLLSQILDVFVPRGWFLKITPGTKLITVGGAIASDVHGKNHHVSGCFSECVEMFHLMLPDGNAVQCSKTVNTELFRATCGGMGLTGVILDARILLQRIGSASLSQTTVKARDLEETFEAFEQHEKARFSVAWIDCFATSAEMGRSLLTIGEFKNDGALDYRSRKKLNVPRGFPAFMTNKLSAKAFNQLYYSRVRERESVQTVGIDTFFYPLDAIDNWNRVYGKSGFIQYNFVLPKGSSHAGLKEVLTTVSHSGPGSYLAVLKLCGPENDNLLSFPMEGYGLAMDFKIVQGLFEHLDELDRIVLKHGGRIYLTKDARVSKAVLEQGYPRIAEFRSLRKKYKMDQKFNSEQSRRVGI